MNTPPIAKSEQMVNGQQVRAARAWLNWSQQELADASRVAKRTVVRIERDGVEPSSQARTLIDIRRVLEEAGIQFLFDDHGGIGIAVARTPDGRTAAADGDI